MKKLFKELYNISENTVESINSNGYEDPIMVSLASEKGNETHPQIYEEYLNSKEF